MSAIRESSVGLRFIALVTLGCTGAIGGVAWHRGLINPRAWLAQSAATVAPTEFTEPQPPKVEAELEPELVEAQSEPEFDEEAAWDQKPAGLSARNRKQNRPMGRLDIGSDDEGSGRVETANFEEEEEAAPLPVSETPVRSTGRTRDGVASAKSGETVGRAAQPIVDGEIGAFRNGPLVDIDRIEALEAEGDLIAAQRELSRWYWRKPAEREQILPALNRMARKLYFSPQPHYYEPYVVRQGDQLRVIGQKHKLSWEYLSRLNHVDSRKIRAGQKLKVVPGSFAAWVSLSRYELVVHLDGSFVKNYRVGVGKDGATPLGTFTVKNKMVDPTYYGPDGVIAHDDPQNPLGERWIDIGDSFGIHGTIEPSSIGKNESRGCIRMLNSDVEEVYDFLVNGSEVRIQR